MQSFFFLSSNTEFGVEVMRSTHTFRIRGMCGTKRRLVASFFLTMSCRANEPTSCINASVIPSISRNVATESDCDLLAVLLQTTSENFAESFFWPVYIIYLIDVYIQIRYSLRHESFYKRIQLLPSVNYSQGFSSL